MIVRSFGLQALRQCAKRPLVPRATVRRFSSTSLASESSAPITHPLVGVTTQFDHVAPRFEVEPSQIEILNSPAAFYQTLKVVETEKLSSDRPADTTSRPRFGAPENEYTCPPSTSGKRSMN